MTVGNLNPMVGSLGNDPLFNSFFANDNSNNLLASNLDIIYGLQGNDNLSTDPSLTSEQNAVLVGGSGEDQYLIGNNNSVVILDNGNSNGDSLITSGIGFNRPDSYALTIDNRHLYAFDTTSNQYVLLIDWQAPENRLETIEVAGGQILNFDQFVVELNNIRNDPTSNFLGDFTWENVQTDSQLQSLGAEIDLGALDLSTETINSAIDEVVATANNFENTITSFTLPNQTVTGSLSDTDNSYISDNETYYYDFYSFPVETVIEPGDIVTINISSSEFDPLLMILDSKGNVLEFDADGDDELTFGVGSGEPFFVSVESRNPNETGNYSLAIETVDVDPISAGLDDTNASTDAIYDIDRIQTRDSLTGSLSEDDNRFTDPATGDIFYLDNFLVDGNVGDVVNVTLDSVFDAELSISSIDNLGVVNLVGAVIDNVGAGQVERTNFTIQAGFEYVISVDSVNPMTPGDYTLTTSI
ncbi:hypothetical protein [Pleurocapsa sp. PCC 7319]|uniref:hypothetical protein n=1 Tax=Pleurocapsa sp. PCC 7319 TaxID=118161 RepID=UPI000372A690|nr:hypothetical protein [Pleurocapsa sp. PCC 7319]